MRILMYGRLADIAGGELHLPEQGGCTVAELRQRLAETYDGLGPALSRLGVRACVEDTIVPEDHQLLPAAEVEFFPPVSGG